VKDLCCISTMNLYSMGFVSGYSGDSSFCELLKGNFYPIKTHSLMPNHVHQSFEICLSIGLNFGMYFFTAFEMYTLRF
jgi:hypothetical protein